MLLYDIQNGIVRRRRWLLLPALIWLLGVCYLTIYTDLCEGMSFGACLFILLTGGEPIDLAMRSFSVPFLWLFLQLGYVLFTVEYPTRDMNSFGQQIMVRAGSRSGWIMSKCLWTVLSTAIYWAVGYIVLLLFCAFGGLSLTLAIPGELVQTTLSSCDIPREVYPAAQTLLPLIVMPLLTSAAVCLIQLLAAVAASEVIAVSVSVFLLIWSACVRTPFAIGNYAMMQRCSLFGTKGLSYPKGIPLLLCIAVGAVVGAVALFGRRDILGAKKNGE